VQELKELTGLAGPAASLPKPDIGARMRRFGLIARFLVWVFPEVERELGRWRQQLEVAGDPELQRQGLASIGKKRFHAQGGSFYALSVSAAGKTPGYAGTDDSKRDLVAFIVAFQTISDYLDNLCDRTGCLETTAFRQLHLAYTDALDPYGGVDDYYRFYPYRDDGGYLTALVKQCRAVLRRLPSWRLVQGEVLRLAGLYTDLQTFKHTFPHLREGLLQNWAVAEAGAHGDLDWWEFAAATGSTLGIFALCAAAADPGLTPESVRQLSAGYFPWISGLHILLDYFIDQGEDQATGDLNFVSYYAGEGQCQERLLLFLKRALDCAAALPDPWFHTTVVHGLPAFYLSDPKAQMRGLDETAGLLLAGGGRETTSMYRICRLLRRLRKL
jgi:tetraprenyl-beta-curcumene synthase